MVTYGQMRRHFALAALVFALITTGLAFMIYEIVFLKELMITLGGTVYASSATLSSVMFGLFLGSQVFGVLSGRVKDAAVLFIILEAGLLFCSLGSVPLLRMIGSLESWPLRFGLSFAVVMIPSALVGGEIPVAMQLLERSIEKGKLGLHAGMVYGADTFGALLGALAVPFLLMPYLGAYRTTLVAGAANGLSGLAMLYWARKGRKGFVVSVLLMLALLGAGFSEVGAALDQHTAVGALRFRFRTLLDYMVFHKTWDSRFQRIQIMDFKFKQILKESGNRSRGLYLDGVSQVSVESAVEYGELILFGLLAHPDPKDVLVIGCGDGGLIKAALKDPRVRSLDQIEIDAEVVRVAKEYLREVCCEGGRSVWDDPRVRLHYADGRQFLRDGAKRYDLVFSDLPHVLHEGASVFYSEEFLRLVRSRLKPGGIFMDHSYHPDVARWDSDEDQLIPYMLVARTVQEVFGRNLFLFETALWPESEADHDDAYALSGRTVLAYKDGLSLKDAAVRRRFAALEPRPERMTPEILFRWFSNSEIPAWLGRFPVSTDDKPTVLYPHIYRGKGWIPKKA